MSTRIKKVFLSSTSKDLVEFRKAVYEAIHRMDGYHCIRMEDFGARDWKARDFCHKRVVDCELFIIIVGHLHGSCPEGSKQSFTEIEYETAIRTNKPRLIFVTPDNFRISADHIESDNKRKRQLAFRERVAKERIYTSFETPSDLAASVTVAVRNREQELFEREHMRQSFLDNKGGQPQPVLGEDAFKTCNRTPQQKKFKACLDKNLSSGNPHIYFLLGEKEDCHESLVDRLVYEDVTSTSEIMWGKKVRSPIYEKFQDWEYDDEITDPETQVKIMLSLKFKPAFSYEELSANTLDKLICSRVDVEDLPPCPIVVIQHSIALSRWSNVSRRILEAYIGYWAEMIPTPSSKRFLIFINFWYPKARNYSWWRSLFASKTFNKKNFETELKDVLESKQGRCHSLILNLTPVYEDQVLGWFSSNNLYSQDVRLRKVQEIFTDKKGRAVKEKRMADIEASLRKIVKEIRRGVQS